MYFACILISNTVSFRCTIKIVATVVVIVTELLDADRFPGIFSFYCKVYAVEAVNPEAV
jgi:hypothetical protein